jgi:NitT/TauT family transport system substrate-binding protein
MAIEAGTRNNIFEDHNIEIDRVDIGSGGSVMRAIDSGDVEFAATASITGTFASFQEGADVRIVGNQWNSATDFVWYSTGDSGIESLDDLDDASIGFSAPGSSTQATVLNAIEQSGAEDAEAVATGGIPDTNSALQTGEIDVAWTVPPFFFQGILSDKYNEVFRGADIEPFGDMSARVILASGDWLNNDSDIADDFFEAWSASWDWVYDNLDESIQYWGELVDEDDHDFLKELQQDTYPWENINPSNLRNLDAAMDIAVEFDFIDSPLSDEERDELIYEDYYL